MKVAWDCRFILSALFFLRMRLAIQSILSTVVLIWILLVS
jgi:hypothetical protein